MGSVTYKNITFNETTLFTNQTQVWRFEELNPESSSKMISFNFETNIMRLVFTDLIHLKGYVGDNPIEVLLQDQQ
jgi:hypothetical protein